MTKRLLILLLLVLSNPVAQADGNRNNFGHIDYRNGLSHNHVLCFAEDDNGFMWIGTRSGLNRFDGYNFKIFRHDQHDPNSLPDNMVQRMVKDQLGRIWINTSGGMTIFNPNTEEFTRDFTLSFDEGNFNLFNLDMVIPVKDSLLFLRVPGTGLIKFNIYTNKSWLLRPLAGNPETLSSANISFFAVSGETLYIIHRNGTIDMMNIRNDRVFRRIESIRQAVNKECDFELYLDHRQDQWIYANGEALGIYRIDTLNRLQHYYTESWLSLNSNIVTGIIQDEQNNYWIGTDHGGGRSLSPWLALAHGR